MKFYDLNRPEPICPKCGADQRSAGKAARAPARPAAAPRSRKRSINPSLLEEEEESVPVRDEGVKLEMDVADGQIIETPTRDDSEEEDT